MIVCKGSGIDSKFPAYRAAELNALVALKEVGIDWVSPGGTVELEKHEWVYKTAVPEPRRQRCQYCAQVSPDDSRGGCVACGGPR